MRQIKAAYTSTRFQHNHSLWKGLKIETGKQSVVEWKKIVILIFGDNMDHPTKTLRPPQFTPLLEDIKFLHVSGRQLKR